MVGILQSVDMNIIKKEMPSPTPEEMASPQFEAIWNIIKTWDINVPDYYRGYLYYLINITIVNFVSLYSPL